MIFCVFAVRFPWFGTLKCSKLKPAFSALGRFTWISVVIQLWEFFLPSVWICFYYDQCCTRVRRNCKSFLAFLCGIYNTKSVRIWKRCVSVTRVWHKMWLQAKSFWQLQWTWSTLTDLEGKFLDFGNWKSEFPCSWRHEVDLKGVFLAAADVVLSVSLQPQSTDFTQYNSYGDMSGGGRGEALTRPHRETASPNLFRMGLLCAHNQTHTVKVFDSQ